MDTDPVDAPPRPSSPPPALFSVGDDIFVKTAAEDELPYIGRIESIESLPEGIEVHLSWYYRPEEVKGGRKCFHGGKEILMVRAHV